MSGISTAGAERALGAHLGAACRAGGLSRALVCTHEGLLVASAGDDVGGVQERLAALTSLFADIVARAERDLSMGAVDEVTLLDGRRGRVVIRPLWSRMGVAMFLVVELPRAAVWRRCTGALALDLRRVLDETYRAEVS